MASTHDDLVGLFEKWRAFESPPLLNGAPDYTAERFAIRQHDYLELRARLGLGVTVDMGDPREPSARGFAWPVD